MILILNIIYEICAILLSAKNFKTIERGLHEVSFSCSFSLRCMSSGICTCSRDKTTSAVTVISTFVCTVQALDQANIVEECVLLSALLHIFAGLKRTRDQKLSSGLMVHRSLRSEEKRLMQPRISNNSSRNFVIPCIPTISPVFEII